MLGNLRLKLLAIFFAVALWGVVAYASNPTQSHKYDLPVAVQGLPTGLVVVGAAPRVSVTVTATADNLRAFLSTDLNAVGNFSNTKVGNNRVPIRVDSSDPAVQVDAPTAVPIAIDQLSTTTLNVSIVRVHSLLPGYHEVPNSASVTPPSVQVSGPKSKLANIQAVVRVDLDGVAAPAINAPYPVVVLDAKGTSVPVTVLPATVTVKMAIEADAITVNKPVGFTLVGQPAAGYRVTNVQISPLVVQATGLQGTLGTVTILSTDPVDITGQKSDVIRTVTIHPPNGVTVSQKTVTVHVYISTTPGVSPSPSGTP